MSTAIKIDGNRTSKETIEAYTGLVKQILDSKVDQVTIQAALDSITRVFNINLTVKDCDFNLASEVEEEK